MIARRGRATLLCQNRTLVLNTRPTHRSSLLSRVDCMCPVDSRLSPPGAHVLGDPASTPPIAYSYIDLPARLPGLKVVACRSECLTHVPYRPSHVNVSVHAKLSLPPLPRLSPHPAHRQRYRPCEPCVFSRASVTGSSALPQCQLPCLIQVGPSLGLTLSVWPH